MLQNRSFKRQLIHCIRTEGPTAVYQMPQHQAESKKTRVGLGLSSPFSFVSQALQWDNVLVLDLTLTFQSFGSLSDVCQDYLILKLTSTGGVPRLSTTRSKRSAEFFR